MCSDDTVFAWPVFAAGRIYTDTMMELLIAQVAFISLRSQTHSNMCGAPGVLLTHGDSVLGNPPWR